MLVFKQLFSFFKACCSIGNNRWTIDIATLGDFLPTPCGATTLRVTTLCRVTSSRTVCECGIEEKNTLGNQIWSPKCRSVAWHLAFRHPAYFCFAVILLNFIVIIVIMMTGILMTGILMTGILMTRILITGILLTVTLLLAFWALLFGWLPFWLLAF